MSPENTFFVGARPDDSKFMSIVKIGGYNYPIYRVGAYIRGVDSNVYVIKGENNSRIVGYEPYIVSVASAIKRVDNPFLKRGRLDFVMNVVLDGDNRVVKTPGKIYSDGVERLIGIDTAYDKYTREFKQVQIGITTNTNWPIIYDFYYDMPNVHTELLINKTVAEIEHELVHLYTESEVDAITKQIDVLFNLWSKTTSSKDDISYGRLLAIYETLLIMHKAGDESHFRDVRAILKQKN